MRVTSKHLQQFIILKYFQKMDSEPVQRCDNCLKDFPESKMATHFGYCRRNIKKCSICHEMYDINFKEEHEEEFHRKEKCPHCSKEFPQSDYKEHERRCDNKPKFCQYCQLNVPVATFATHFAACQSRTKPCTKCNKPIMNKDYLIHVVSCEGVVEARKPASYQHYLQQHSKKTEEVYPKPQIDRVSSRERPIGIKPRQQNKYAEITNKREDVKVYDPRIISQPRQEQNKRQYINYPPQQKPEIKKEEVPTQKRYTGSINQANGVKKQDSRSIAVKPQALSTEQVRRPNGSREAPREIPRAPVSNKDLFPQPSVKDSKSYDKNSYLKKQEDPRAKYAVPTYNRPQQIKRQTVDNRIKNPIIPKPRQQVVRKKSPQVKQEYVNHNDLGEFVMSPQEQMMQEILMQSAKEQRGGALKNQKVAPTIKPSPKIAMKDMPFIEGEDFMNQSFIEKQRAIQEELSRNYKGR